ncbi:MAG: AAA family ATPase [Polyangiaceae bacterium]
MDSEPAPSQRAVRPSTGVRLRAFELHNYRLFKRARLAVHPRVTVLVGLNDVGKSTLLDAIRLYGLIEQQAGFRGPLSDEDFSGTGELATRLVAEWEDASGLVWHHCLTLDAGAPEERLSAGERFWSWNPKTRHLETERGTFDAKEVSRFSSLALVEPKRWQLDTDVPPEIYEPLSIARSFHTPQAYLFEPSALAKPAPISWTTPSRNGFAWGTWLQDIINRRNDDISVLEGDTRRLFPFFGSVSVKEQRVQIQREEREITSSRSMAPSAVVSKGRASKKNRAPIVVARDTGDLLDQLSDLQSTREVFIDVHGAGQGAGSMPQRIRAAEASSGLLLALSHFALLHATAEGDLLLLEEPENGLNGEVTLEMIRAFLGVVERRQQQLILTTHHPFWLDLVEPESIRLLTRDASGAHIREVAEEVKARPTERHLREASLMGTYGPQGLLYVQDRSEG